MDVQLTKTRRYIALTGSLIDDIATFSNTGPAPQTPYHITLLTKAETQYLSKRLDNILAQSRNIDPPINLGIGRRGMVRFCVIFWPQGNALRKQLGLPPKQFHITLSSTDDHTVDKSVDFVVKPALLTADQVEKVVQECIALSKDKSQKSAVLEVVRFMVHHHSTTLTDRSFDGIWRLLSKLSSKQEAADLATAYNCLRPDSVAGHLRIADCADLPLEAKQAMFHYAIAANLSLGSKQTLAAITSVCIEGIVKCSTYTEYGLLLFDPQEIKANRNLLRQAEEAFQNPEIRRLIQDKVAETSHLDSIDELLSTRLSLPSNIHFCTPYQGKLYSLPRFFRWLIPFRLAIMSTPRWKEDIVALAAQNITLIVTLTEEEPLPTAWFANTTCKNVFMPVTNYGAPSIAQVDAFVQLVDELSRTEAALVHCGGGKGRAGTFAACYLMARGLQVANDGEEQEQKIYLYPADAIRLVRHMRPGSIETVEQENFIKKYAQHLISGKSVEEEMEDISTTQEPQNPLELNGDLPSNPSLIICCGIPGSGKSTFATVLANSLSYTPISQDELGSRSACLTALSNALQLNQKIVIDRCNPYIEDRELWLAHAFHPRDAVCVWFDVDAEICVRRAEARTGHPTVRKGTARKVVKSFVKTFVQPSLAREKFVCVARVSSRDASHELLTLLGVQASELPKPKSEPGTLPTTTPGPTQKATRPKLHKFPRTRHLFASSSATRDDLILHPTDALAFLTTTRITTLTLEEKLDGANLGLSICPLTQTLLIQNRSHFITPSSHAQFSPLTSWLSTHKANLETILLGENSEWQAGRWVLFGEWMFARHSIHYTHLPDLFVAFDLYDTVEKDFLCREEVASRLRGLGIRQVPEVERPEVLDEGSLKELVRSLKSRYCDSLAEGVYLRRECGGRTVDRAKIVREDFIAGDERWNRGGIVRNRVVYEED